MLFRDKQEVLFRTKRCVTFRYIPNLNPSLQVQADTYIFVKR